MYTAEDHEPADGDCFFCGGNGVVKLSDVNLCLTHYAREQGLTDRQAVDYLKNICNITVNLNSQTVEA